MSVVGPLGRSAADLRTALRVTAGPEQPAGRAYSWQLAPPRHRRLEDTRVGFVLDHPAAPVSSEVSTVLEETVHLLDKRGASMVEGWPAGIRAEAQAESFGFHVAMFLAHHA